MCKGLEPGLLPGSGTQSTGEAGERQGRGRLNGPSGGLPQTLLWLTLASTLQCRQGQKRKLRPREVTQRIRGRAPIESHLLRKAYQ